MEARIWKNCSSCKKPIGFNQPYFICSVSSCQGDRTGYAFCSIFCWERHLPGAKHRDAGAVEKTSPRSMTVASSASPGSAQQSAASIDSASSVGWVSGGKTSMDNEVLVVVSKLKTYIKEKADMNTSGDVSDILSHKLRRLCDQAIEKAKADNRKTVMGKDF